nr:IgGFc-binding protein-like [Aotus nancymaae]
MVCQEHSCKPGQVCQPSGGILSCVTKDPCHGVTCRPQETCKEQGGQGVCVPNYEATCWLWASPPLPTPSTAASSTSRAPVTMCWQQLAARGSAPRT